MLQTGNAAKFAKTIPVKPDTHQEILYQTVLDQNHVMIAGESGSGKSVFINGLVYTLLSGYKGSCSIVLCDPKRVELSRYKDNPIVCAFANTSADIAVALKKVHTVMMNRYTEMEKSGEVLYSGEDLYVFVDEIADLLLIAQEKKEIKTLLQSLCQLGRAAKIHCILATQSPSRKTLPAELLVNIMCRVALRCETAIESRQVLNFAGAEDLPKHGKCILKIPSGVYTENVYMYPEEDIRDMISYYETFRKSGRPTSAVSSARKESSFSFNFDFRKFLDIATAAASFALIFKFVCMVIS